MPATLTTEASTLQSKSGSHLQDLGSVSCMQNHVPGKARARLKSSIRWWMTLSVNRSLKNIRTLEELNRLWAVYLEEYYHKQKHAGIAEYYESLGAAVPEEGISPLQEWNRDSRPLTFLDAAVVSEAFLHHEQRKVDRGACISFRGKRYETKPSLIGHTVEISYDPAAPEQITVSYQGMELFTAMPVVIGRIVIRVRPCLLPCRNRPLRLPAFWIHWKNVMNRTGGRWQMPFPLPRTGRRRMTDV